MRLYRRCTGLDNGWKYSDPAINCLKVFVWNSRRNGGFDLIIQIEMMERYQFTSAFHEIVRVSRIQFISC